MRPLHFFLSSVLLAWSNHVFSEALTTAEPAIFEANNAKAVTLKELAAMIARADELVQAQKLEEHIASQGVRGAKGIYEPNFMAALERDYTYVTSSAVEYYQRSNQKTFGSRENRLKLGLGVKVQTGADIEFSYNLAQNRNTLQPLVVQDIVSPEYRGYLGLKIDQPLLRGAGKAATEAGINIAQTEQSVAKETVRQVLSQRLMDGIQAFIMVQRAEERVRVRKRVVEVAAAVAKEMAQQQNTGLRSKTELTEAEANHALRRAQLAQSLQDLEEQLNQLQTFVAADDQNKVVNNAKIRPADSLYGPLPSKEQNRALSDLLQQRPEMRVAQVRIEREGEKAAQAKDQMRPELNFAVRYGKESLTEDPIAIDRYFSSRVPYNSWTVGLTLKMGLFGDEKRQSDYQVAALKKEQAELTLKALEQRIGNEIQASGRVVEHSSKQMQAQKDIVEAQRQLLNNEKNMQIEGRRSMLDVYKKELELLQAEEAFADVVALATRSSYLYAQTTGTLLAKVGLE